MATSRLTASRTGIVLVPSAVAIVRSGTLWPGAKRPDIKASRRLLKTWSGKESLLTALIPSKGESWADAKSIIQCLLRSRERDRPIQNLIPSPYGLSQGSGVNLVTMYDVISFIRKTLNRAAAS